MKVLIAMMVVLLIVGMRFAPAGPTTVATTPTTGTASGIVVDANGKAVPNVKVRFKKVLSRDPVGKDSEPPKKPSDNLDVAVVASDKDGKFSQALEAGEYWAEIRSKSLGYDKERFQVTAGQTTDLKLTLTRDDPQGK